MGSDTQAWRRSPRKTSLTWLCRGPPSRFCTTALAIRVRWPMFPRLMPPAALGEGASGRWGPPGSALPRPLPQASCPWSSLGSTGSHQRPPTLNSERHTLPPRRRRPCSPASGQCRESHRRAPRDLGEPRPLRGPSSGQQQGWLSPPAWPHGSSRPLTRPQAAHSRGRKTPGFPRSETQPSCPRGTAPLSTVFSLLSSVTAREDTKGPDFVGPPGRHRGPRDWEELAQRRSRMKVEACEQAAQDAGELG